MTTVPASWMPAAKMQRVIVHWTAGAHKASALDKKHYHIMVEGGGTLVRGDKAIKLNEAPAKKGYAAHTLNCNSGSIGVSVCCMAGAIESPFNAGKHPMTRVQWDAMMAVVADLCTKYKIPVTPETVLSHAEVQGTLGIKQRGKWDIARLAFDPSVKGAKAVGGRMRREVKAAMGITVVGPRPLPPIDEEDLDEPPEPLVPTAATGYTKTQIMDVQQALLDAGYIKVGGIDGIVGENTRDAIHAFRENNGLPESYDIDGELIAALADPAAVGPTILPERAEATVADIRAKGSTIVNAQDKQLVGAAGVATVTAAPKVIDLLTSTGEQVAEVTEKLSPFQAALEFAGDWAWVAVVAIVAFLVWQGLRVYRARLRDHQTGNTSVVGLPEKIEERS